MLGHILSEARGDFRILANPCFATRQGSEPDLLPISFDEPRGLQAEHRNPQTALDYLGQGARLGFSLAARQHGARPFGAPMDPGWRSFTARMIAKSERRWCRCFLTGTPAGCFRWPAICTHSALGLLIKEFRNAWTRLCGWSSGAHRA